MSEQAGSTLGGAAQGAQAGMVFGPVGAAVGAVIGGIVGAVAGTSARRGRIVANRAKRTERLLSYTEQAVQRRDMLRQARMARAQQLAAATAQGTGGLQSSNIQGALASTESQASFNLRYFDTRLKDYARMQTWYNKAGKAQANAANTMGGLQAVAGAVSAFGGMGGSGPSSSGAVPSNSGGQYNMPTEAGWL